MTLVIGEFIHEVMDDFGLLDTLKYMVRSRKQEKLKMELKYLQYIGNRIGLINLNQVCEKVQDSLKQTSLSAYQLQETMQVLISALKDNVTCLLEALQMTHYNLEVKFDMRYYLKSDHRKALLLRQNGLFEETTPGNANIFIDQEYEDI